MKLYDIPLVDAPSLYMFAKLLKPISNKYHVHLTQVNQA